MTNKERARIEALVKGAPPLRKRDLEAINRAFPAYIFRVRSTGEVWTTCCGRHETIGADASAEVRALLDAPHQREPKKWDGYCCHAGYMSAPPPAKKIVEVCPWCGHEVKVKELGRTGGRQNLHAWRRAVVLRQWRGALWAVAYDASKGYGEKGPGLTALPDAKALGIYRFRPGLVERAGRAWAGARWSVYTRMDAPPGKLPMRVGEPFHWNSGEGMSYTAVGLDELERGYARYCHITEYLKGESGTAYTDALIRSLTLCAFWPRQFEMLVKLGLTEAVDDLIYRRKWNRAALDWRETDPRKSFELDGRELREWLAEGGSLELLGCYKRLRRSQGKADFMAIQAVRSEAGAVFERLVPKLARYGLRPERLAAYIHKERERPGSKRTDMQTLYTEWADYIEDAQLLGYDLSNPVFLTPKDLRKKHAATIVPAARLRDVKAGKDQKEKERARQKAVTARYCYSTDRWLIRAPVGPGEIAAEGAALRHCVGGYAGRHQNGLTTILFLRDRRRPGRPLATIEMQGDKLVQIHGFRNDRYAKVTPRERYAEILEPWLAWVAAGSKRDKKGRPRRPAQKKTSAA